LFAGGKAEENVLPPRVPLTGPKINDNQAYVDEVLIFGQQFRGNDIIKVTVSTFAKVLTSDEETVTSEVGDRKTVSEKKTASR
jgi:hypothetical protein